MTMGRGRGRGRSAWLCIIAFACVAVVALAQRQGHKEMVYVRSLVTQKAYLVQNKPGAQEVADRLAHLEVTLRKFLQWSLARTPVADSRLKRIVDRWDGTLAEVPPREQDVAYSIDKGKIHLCVRSPDGGGLGDYNTCVFVLMHELAHVGCISYGHNDEFWACMTFLLELADLGGFYTYVDHETNPTTLCGLKIATSPLKCVKDGSCARHVARS